MTEIFDLNALPERRIGVRRVASLHPAMNIGEAVIRAQRDMARQLAEIIMQKNDFFVSSDITYGGVSALEYRADCVVLTAEEYRQVRMTAFKEGALHAQGFMRHGDPLK